MAEKLSPKQNNKFKFGYLKKEDPFQCFYFKLERFLMACPSDPTEARTETALLPSIGKRSHQAIEFINLSIF